MSGRDKADEKWMHRLCRTTEV